MTLLAQADPTSFSSIGDFAGKFGFPALLVMVLLWGIYKMQSRADDKQDKREAADAQREKERREEREADRAAHVTALATHTVAINGLSGTVAQLGQKVEALSGRVENEVLRIVKGG